MRKPSLFSALVSIALLSGGAAAAKEKAQDAPKDKKICKSTRTTSSRIPAKRVCKTAAEWAQASQDDLDDAASKLRGAGRAD